MATDGFKYVFVCITNEGVLRLSRQFDVMQEDLPVILGCLGYILEKAIAMSSKFSPKTGVLQTEQIDNDFDEGFNPDDKSFLGYGDECMYELYWGLAYQTVENMIIFLCCLMQAHALTNGKGSRKVFRSRS